MDDGLLSIGAFSRASLLSVKVLRAYHEAGILEPAHVDPGSGYRYYHWSQLSDAAVIRRLRAVDLPLEQVRLVVRSGDPEVTRRVLAEHRSAMEARLDEVARAVEQLHEGVRWPTLHTPVHVRSAGPVDVLATSGEVREADLDRFFDAAFPRLEEAANGRGLAPSGPPGGLYPGEIADEVEQVSAFLPVNLPPGAPAPPLPPWSTGPAAARRPVGPGPPVVGGQGEVVAVRLPAVDEAVAVHAGGYDSIADTYRHLGAWVAQHAVPSGHPVRELYLVSYGDTDDPTRFRTEICWPVVP